MRVDAATDDLIFGSVDNASMLYVHLVCQKVVMDFNYIIVRKR